MKTWEYTHLCSLHEESGVVEIARMDKLGKEGWELVSTIERARTGSIFHYFKREVEDRWWSQGKAMSADKQPELITVTDMPEGEELNVIVDAITQQAAAQVR